MDELYDIIGKTQSLEKLSELLKNTALDLHPAVIGAHHVTCSDETERECLDVFSKTFVSPLLPTLKLSQQAAFRTANLGSRYEWSSVRIAEHHFATSATESSFKLMVIKINSHSSRVDLPKGYQYGRMDRYNEQSDCCGALFALMNGASLPAVDSIRETFEWEGLDRVTALNDPERVSDDLRGLAAAITQARLQARLCMADIRDHEPYSPTLYLVIPSVTINIADLDDELLVGVYTADVRTDEPKFEYRGLGDSPEDYVFEHIGARVRVTDSDWLSLRPARDHRRLPLVTYLEGGHQGTEKIKSRGRYRDSGPEKVLDLLAREAPVEGALRLFSEGLVPIHHVLRADRIARDPGAAFEAQLMLGEVRSSFKALNDEDADAVTDTLCNVVEAI